MTSTSDLPALIERWFTDRLIRHRGSSANTIASYRDTFRLLFAFAQDRLRRPPSKLNLSNGVQKGPPIGVEEGPPFQII